MSSSSPIGVFDSGIGGLTVAHAIIRRLPRESVVYFGDTARVPYGPKSPDTVRRYSHEIAGFLQLPIPVLGVVEPGARAAVRASAGGHVGVIGTTGTVRSGAYERAIRALDDDVRVTARACPLFVPLVEEGWVDHPVTRQVAQEYLDPLLRDHVNALVLGCTHYPLLKSLICRVVGQGVALIDSAEETAAELARVLHDERLEASADAEPTHRFIASDDPLQFLQLGQRFLGDAIESVEIHTFV